MIHEGTIEHLLASITTIWCNDPVFRNTCKNIQIDPKDWPDGDAKSILNEFEAALDQKQARAACKKVFSTWPSLNFSDVPRAPEELLNIYSEKLFLWKIRSVATELIDHPHRFHELVPELLSSSKKDPMFFDLKEALKNDFQKFSEKIRNKSLTEAIFGWPILSDMIGGFNPGRASMLLAETGYGKTNLCLNLALAANKTKRVVYVNMEMLREDIAARSYVMLSGVSWKEIRDGNVPTYQPIADKLTSPHDFIMSDGKDKSVKQIRDAIRRLHFEKPVGFVVIDYDQKLLLQTNFTTPEWKAMQDAFVELEAMSKELNCYVLISAQTSDKDGKVSASNRSKFPCSTVLFFHDDEVYGSIVEIKKNRYGPMKRALKVNYDSGRSQVSEIEVIDVERTTQRPRAAKNDLRNSSVPINFKGIKNDWSGNSDREC